MPGSITNTTILAGLNELIRALNENTEAIAGQSLNPVTYVNFDTEAIATEISNIRPFIQNLSEDTDKLAGLDDIGAISTATTALAGRVSPDGETLTGVLITNTTALTDAQGANTTALTDAQAANTTALTDKLTEIRDRLADTDDNIARAIRESRSTITKSVDLSVKSTVSDEIKCRNAITYIGYLSAQLRLAQETTAYRASIATNTLDIIAEWFKGSYVQAMDPAGAGAGAVSGIVSLANIWQEFTIADFTNFVSEFENAKEAFVCDIYSAPTPTDAIVNIRETVELGFTPEHLLFQGMDEILLASSDMLARVFSDGITGNELARYTLWSNSDCSNCAPIGCGNRFISGTGEPFIGGYIRYNETIRLSPTLYTMYSELDLQFDSPTAVTIIAQTDGEHTDWQFFDCEGNLCSGLNGQMNGDMPFTVTCYRFKVKNSQPQFFFVDVSFAMGELEPGGCGLDLSCMPQSGLQVSGTPDVIVGDVWNIGAYPVGTWATITSEWYPAGVSGRQEISIRFDDSYHFELEILTLPSSLPGYNLLIEHRDCAGLVSNVEYDTPGLVPINQAWSVYIRSNPYYDYTPGGFTVRIRRVT